MPKFIIIWLIFLSLAKLGDFHETDTPCGRVRPESGKITYTYPFFGNVTCNWIIESENPEDRVKIKFTKADFHVDRQQVLTVFEPHGISYNIKSEGQRIMTSGNPVNISFKSFEGKFYSIEVEYTIIKRCGTQTLENPIGTFVSLHKQDVNCIWNIVPKSQNPNETFDVILIKLSRRYTYCLNQNETYSFSDGQGKNFEYSCQIGDSLPELEEFHVFTQNVSLKLTKNSDEGAYEISYNASKFKRYGENCTKSDLCDPYNMTKCSEQGTCQCFKESMVFSQDEQKCLASFKNHCYFPMGVIESEATNATCQEQNKCLQGFCECDPAKYFENRFGNCETKFKYSENCTSNEECDQNNFLSCISGKCGCNSNYQIIDSKRTTCLVKLGHACDNGTFCLENGHCLKDLVSNSSTCSCSVGFAESSGGRCHNDYGKSCSASSPCADLQFECISDNLDLIKKCKCNGGFSEYNSELKKCLSPNGGECKRPEDCLENMICEFKPIFKSSRCKCPTNLGFTLDEGYCYPTNGSKCSSINSQCFSNLLCRNDVCLCGTNEQYSKSQNKCFFVCNEMNDCPNLSSDTKCVKNQDTYSEFGAGLGKCVKTNNFQSNAVGLSQNFLTTFLTLLIVFLVEFL